MHFRKLYSRPDPKTLEVEAKNVAEILTPEQTKQQLISQYFRELSHKSHQAVVEKYGKDYYKRIGSMKKKPKDSQTSL